MFDLYVWLPEAKPQVLRRFVDDYVDVEHPGDDRLHVFIDVYINGLGNPERYEVLNELKLRELDKGFALYVKGVRNRHAMITLTEDDALVLGLSIPDEDEGGDGTLDMALSAVHHLKVQFNATADIVGFEEPPPRSRKEWDEAHVTHRCT